MAKRSARRRLSLTAYFFVTVSGLVKEVATLLSKITRDLRLMRSGPRSGFMEVRLPP